MKKKKKQKKKEKRNATAIIYATSPSPLPLKTTLCHMFTRDKGEILKRRKKNVERVEKRS